MSDSDFDVFLCHNSRDKPAVEEIGLALRERGLRPWLDVWELQPGLPWQPGLEAQIRTIGVAAVFVGTAGQGPWQDMEIQAFLRQFVKRGCPVIPVILPGCADVPELPVFLEGMTWVDFRVQRPDPLDQLIWGITGKNPSSGEAATASATPTRISIAKLPVTGETFAERGHMRLHEADVHLEWPRLLLQTGDRDAARRHLARARELVASTGYGRRERKVAFLAEELER